MKRLIVFLFLMLCGVAHSAQIVNVEYIHNAIRQKWGVMVPYNSELTNPRVVANMKYLLTAVDVANEILNGGRLTDYGNGEYATMVAVDTIATDTAVDRLILKDTDYKLKLTHYYHREGYSGDIRDPNHLIMISAAGTYNINWGDGTRELIKKNTVGEQWFGHDYASDGYYTVSIGGQATKYSDDPDLSTVIFGTSSACLDEWGWGGKCPLGITDINGCLGCVFPTLEDGSQPRFIETFADASDLWIDIPSGLFSGIHGAPVENMFERTFYYSGITSIPSDLFAGLQGPPAENMFYATFAATYIESIPEDLFAGLQGPPAENMFNSTFTETGITSIPSGLFAGIQGPPAENMFYGTFATNFMLESIPEDLFAGIQGPPAENMFASTFQYNTGLASIPENLFAGIDTAAPYASWMFHNTFAFCYNLTGPSARINGQYLYNIWSNVNSYDGTYSECDGLDDWDSIPDKWK